MCAFRNATFCSVYSMNAYIYIYIYMHYTPDQVLKICIANIRFVNDKKLHF